MVVLASFMSIRPKFASFWKRYPCSENPPSQDLPVGKSVVCIFDWWWLIDWLIWEIQLTVGGVPSGMVVLNAIQRKSGQTMMCMPVSSTPPRPLHQLLHSALFEFSFWFPEKKKWYESGSEINPFLPKLLLILEFHYSNRKLKQTSTSTYLSDTS